MYAFLNYNFCGDQYALDTTPTSVEQFINVKLTNGVFDHIRLSKTALDMGQGTIPEAWDVNTILDCNFENNIAGGNIQAVAALITSIKIKRRVASTTYTSDPSFDWITLQEYPIEDMSSFSFVFNDLFARSGETYEYAFVPVMNNIEGDYVIATAESQFNAVFVSDATGIYKLKCDITYGDTEYVNLSATVEPIGNKYPIVVKNSETAYHRGTVSGLALPSEYYTTGVIDAERNVYFKTLLEEFLHNGLAKILKDWNGNYYLVMVNGSPSVSYLQETGNELFTVNFEWTEVGDPYDQGDLYDAGILEVAE